MPCREVGIYECMQWARNEQGGILDDELGRMKFISGEDGGCEEASSGAGRSLK